MNRHFLMTVMLVGTFILPANAYAKKHQDGSYKPKNAIQEAVDKAAENAEKKRNRNNKNKRAGKKKKANKAVAKKNRPNRAKRQRKKAHNKHHAPAPYVHHRKKKKKHAKIKKIFKKTLRYLAEDTYNQNHYRGPRRHTKNYYGYKNQAYGCVPKHKVFRRLKKNGWRRIRLINQGPNRARLFASNHYGDRYKLVIHKCSGRLIKRIPLDY